MTQICVKKYFQILSDFYLWFMDEHFNLESMIGARPSGLSTASRGITLVEALVVVISVGILAAVLITAMRQAFNSARSSNTLANLRSTAQLFDMWSNDHNGEFLNAGLPRTPGDTTFIDQPDGSLGHIYWSYQAYTDFWTAVMWRWNGPTQPEGHGFSYCVPCYMNPALFAEGSAPYEAWPAVEHWAPQRVSTTAYPSAKGLLLATLQRGGSPNDPGFRPWGIAMVDGSADRHSYTQMVAPLPGFLLGRPTDNPWPVHNTVGGITGRDIR